VLLNEKKNVGAHKYILERSESLTNNVLHIYTTCVLLLFVQLWCEAVDLMQKYKSHFTITS